jgi:tRNA (guanine9-N1)-methyltransferase
VGQKIVVDLDFADLMTDSELKSMCSQLAYCWHINCAARHPAHLVMTSMEVRVRFSLLSCLFVLVCRLACEPVALC